MRLTKPIRDIILNQNNGFKSRTYFKNRNSERERIYKIVDGILYIREVGKTAWSDSRYDKEWIAESDEIRKFIRDNLLKLNLKGIKKGN